MELKPTPRSEWAVENFADALGASETKGRDNASTAVICERVNGGPVEAESLSLADMCLTPLLFSPASPLLPSFPPFPRCLLSSGPVLCLTASRFDVLLRLELDGGLCAVPTSVFCRPMVTHVLCRCIFPHAWCRCGVTNSCVLFHCRGLEALPDLIVCQNLKKLELGSNKFTSIEVRTCACVLCVCVTDANAERSNESGAVSTFAMLGSVRGFQIETQQIDGFETERIV